ncbi:MAG: bacteriohemerythrin [Magnetococcales bacterium]|nr:bacteriohemerythrin [Magnetococcales bacterium]
MNGSTNSSISMAGHSTISDGFQRNFTVDDFRHTLEARLRDVGIPSLHSQHQRLVELIVLLYAEVRTLQKETPREENLASLRNTLDALKEYALRHFQEEERFMQSIQFPDFQAHQSAHHLFVKTLLNLETRMWHDSISYVVDLLHLVVGWLFQHINQLDMVYARFSKGEKLTSTHNLFQASSPVHTIPTTTRAEKPEENTPERKLIQLRENMSRKLFLTGIGEIDRQHMDLMNKITEINVLAERLTTRKPIPQDWSMIDQDVAFLHRYCDTHFITEEAWMRKIGYPKLPIHMREHETLLTRLKGLAQKISQERNVFFIVDLHFFMSEWFFTHTIRSDALYVEYAKSQHIAMK